MPCTTVAGRFQGGGRLAMETRVHGLDFVVLLLTRYTYSICGLLVGVLVSLGSAMQPTVRTVRAVPGSPLRWPVLN